MSLNRQTPPSIGQIDHISIPPLEKGYLSNNIPLYFLNMGDQDIARIDIMVEAGKWQQEKPLVSSFTNLLLKEGAGPYNSREIAEQLDFYGAWLQLSDSYHHSYITLYTLNKYFRETLHLLSLMFGQPLFPEDEFSTLQGRRKQQFLIDNDKVQVLASKGFTHKLFGDKHPYGKTAETADFDRVEVDDLKQFHQEYYHSGNISIILSGKIADTQLKAVEDFFGKEIIKPKHIQSNTDPATIQPAIHSTGSNVHRLFIEKQKSLQNGLRMGLHTINRLHDDFPGLRVLNTILGGYFGSRLMSNIREEKGYTYGISSGITTLKHGSYLSIATQTSCEFTESLIKEVYNEIDRLQSQLTDKQELDMVCNYMLGDFARSLDGTFSIADAHLSLLASDMDTDFFQKQIETIKNISPEEIRRLAQTYLKKEQIIEVIAGELK